MKRIAVCLLALLTVCVFCLVGAAEEASLRATIYVTVSNGQGLALAYEPIDVTDIDGDEALTVHDVLYCAHEAKYVGGAAAGYGTAQTSFGISLTKLWGEVDGVGGYCVNDASALSLSDPVSQGDHVVAYVYTDLMTWGDQYSYFDVKALEGGQISLTLTALGYDENFAPVSAPVENAIITVDGEDTAYRTDGEGKVTLEIGVAGKHLVSARSESFPIVPPVCWALVAEEDLSKSTEPVTDLPEGEAPVTDVPPVENTDGVSDADGNRVMLIILISFVAFSVIAGVASFVARRNKRK